MTLRALRKLCVGDQVCFGVSKRPGGVGVVHAADEAAIEIHWPDETSTLIWFSHAEDGRDMRHSFLYALPAETKESP